MGRNVDLAQVALNEAVRFHVNTTGAPTDGDGVVASAKKFYDFLLDGDV